MPSVSGGPEWPAWAVLAGFLPPDGVQYLDACRGSMLWLLAGSLGYLPRGLPEDSPGVLTTWLLPQRAQGQLGVGELEAVGYRTGLWRLCQPVLGVG